MGDSHDTDTLRGVWHANAADWIRWGRSRTLDHAFWRLNLPAFLELLPPPGRLTVDVGCGEGRLTRILHERAHNVVGFDSSEAMIRAAREEEPDVEVHVCDAAELPLADGAADIAVAFMVLMAMDDPDAVLREIARVLEPGGLLCIAISHPFNTREDVGPDHSYFDTVRIDERLERDGASVTFHDVHRPLGAYFLALERAGFAVRSLREPMPDDDYVAYYPKAASWRSLPIFLHLLAVRS